MWELIRANKIKSTILFIIMAIVLILLGFLIGYGLQAENGGILGIIIALGVWLVMMLVSLTAGSSIMLASSHAKEVTPDVHPQLFNVVEEMRIAAGMTTTPKVYIINTEAPNAFATGIRPEKSAIAVTAGLLSRLNRDELQGVVAHEMSHIINRDIRFMTIAGVMMGSIVIISEIFLRSMFFSGGRGGGDKKGGQIIIIVVALVFAILAPILAQLLYFAISRKREYLADASAVRLTRYPEGLASALEKISNSDADLPYANKVTAPMYICNPMKKKGMKMSDLSSTHPPISERIRILRSMAGGAGFANYQAAYSSVKGSKSNVIPKGELNNDDSVGIRDVGIAFTAMAADPKSTARATSDIMKTVDNYKFIECNCGIRFKVPPDYKDKVIFCPKCGNKHSV
jgi:heat shock protein HtpX